MGVTSALVLYAVFWFMTFLIVIPFRLQTQGDVGEIVEGTQAGAPAKHNLRKKAWITTGIAAVLWGIAFTVITSGWITVDDLQVLDLGGPSPLEAE